MIRQIAATLHEDIEYTWAVLTQNGPKKVESSLLVNGSPKTGTTWMYRMLGSLPGYTRIGNLRQDSTAFYAVRPGSVIHGHEPYSSELVDIFAQRNIRVILMVRDPRDQAVSRMFHARRASDHRWHEKLNRMDDNEALMCSIEGGDGMYGVVDALSFSQHWLDQHGEEVVLVRYETLHDRTFETLQQVLEHCGMAASDQLVRAIIQRNRFERLSRGRKYWQTGRSRGQADTNSHYRKGIVGDWRNHFSAEHKARFKELAGKALIDLGYETNTDW